MKSVAGFENESLLEKKAADQSIPSAGEVDLPLRMPSTFGLGRVTLAVHLDNLLSAIANNERSQLSAVDTSSIESFCILPNLQPSFRVVPVDDSCAPTLEFYQY